MVAMTLCTGLTKPRRRHAGFTLIELLVVLLVLAVLAALVAPHYLERADDAREAVLRHNLHGLRMSIDQFFRDKGRYPASLDELVTARYIRAVPIDPITGTTNSWAAMPPTDGTGDGVFDVRSGAQGQARNGTAYASW